MRRMTLPGSNERGAVAMMVAIFFGTGVFFACAALTIDVGNINADRRQLQNGADAAALSAARDCALGKCPVKGSADPVVQANYNRLLTLANVNAGDGQTKVARVDGKLAVCGTGLGLTMCTNDPNTLNLQECPTPKLPSDKTPFVRVFTQTLDATGTKTLLPYSFGAMIAGAGSGANQQTCASAAWGPESPVGPNLPFAVSACEWYKATHTGTPPVLDPNKYAPLPNSSTYPQYESPYTGFPDTFERALVLNAPLLPVTDPCYSWQGHDFAGGFGWLDRTDAPDCNAIVDAAGWVGVITGAGGGGAGKCAKTIEGYVGHVVHVPVFDCMSILKIGPGPTPPCDNTDNGKHSNYHIQTTAAFFVTAFDTADVSASIDSDHPTQASKDACGKNVKCVYGWFVQDTGGDGTIGGDGTPDYANTVIQVVG